MAFPTALFITITGMTLLCGCNTQSQTQPDRAMAHHDAKVTDSPVAVADEDGYVVVSNSLHISLQNAYRIGANTYRLEVLFAYSQPVSQMDMRIAYARTNIFMSPQKYLIVKDRFNNDMAIANGVSDSSRNILRAPAEKPGDPSGRIAYIDIVTTSEPGTYASRMRLKTFVSQHRDMEILKTQSVACDESWITVNNKEE